MRRTKIVATLGPASSDPTVLRQLIEAGVDVCRLNFSHGSHDDHLRMIQAIRKVSGEVGRPVAILQDLAGPKIRIGNIGEDGRGAVNLSPGDEFTVTRDPVVGDRRRVSLNLPGLVNDAREDDQLLLADGAIELVVKKVSGNDIICKVVVGGLLTSRKGITLTTRSVRVSALTDKDREDMRFGLRHGVDFVALSFVQSEQDVKLAREIASELDSQAPIIAKIERRVALERIAEILDASDGIMVARGDLGLEIPLERVPMVQKMLIGQANRTGKPVITATQMLRSMVENPRPTRAEVTDVANAIFDGTDAVMLSEESAAGKYPVDSVRTMARVCEETENDLCFSLFKAHRPEATASIPDSISRNATDIADELGARAIIAPTIGGATPRLIARYRPRQPIIAVSPRPEVVRRLMLVWGVHPYPGSEFAETDQIMEQAERIAKKAGFVSAGDLAVVTMGATRSAAAGPTNLIKVDRVG